MKKLVTLLVILTFIFMALAVTKKLPEDVQTKVDAAVHKYFPAKDQLQKKVDSQASMIEGAAQ